MSNVIKKRGQLHKTKELFAVYSWLLRNDKELLDKHLPNTVNYWNLEKCKQEALKYKTRSEWKLNSGASYNAALRNKWLEECCTHMEEILKPSGYWNLENCKQEALKYKTKKEWKIQSGASYQAAYLKKWMKKCCSHMEHGLKNRSKK